MNTSMETKQIDPFLSIEREKKNTSHALTFDLDELMNCMRCGFCLPSCPTYRETGKEMFSPRGRIALMKGMATGNTSLLSDEFAQNMYMCLGCRACETACPAGVHYGRLVEGARDVIEAHKRKEAAASDQPLTLTRKERIIRDIVYKKLFLYPKRIDRMGKGLWWMQALGLQTFADRTGLMHILPKPLANMQKAVPKIASPRRRKARQPLVTSKRGVSRGRVGFFTGCVMDVLFFETNEKTARVLSKVGYDVVFVKEQACCGALHAHSGENYGAIALAKQNIEAFERANVDFIVNNAGGCGASLREYAHWLQDDPNYGERAKAFVAKVRDISEFLAPIDDLPFQGTLDATVTFQDSCHLRHGQGIYRQPRALLERIPGITLVELPHADSCCGSAGIYNITNFDRSMRILDDKMIEVKATKASYIVTANPGCLVQMRQGVVRSGLQGQVEAVHIIELLDRVL